LSYTGTTILKPPGGFINACNAYDSKKYCLCQ